MSKSKAVIYIESTDGKFSTSHNHGERTIDTPMLMASITKMFTSACVLILCDAKKISLDDKISTYLDKDTMANLHVYKGRDYSNDLTISHLLFQTSGFSDYFLHKKSSLNWKKSIQTDHKFTFNDIVTESKKLNPLFPPNDKKAFYTDTNYDLLGKILENVTGLSLAEIYKQFIFKPLNMNDTYLPTKEDDFVPPITFKGEQFHRPKVIKSCGASGGGISTPKDLMTFSKAFWHGKLFNKDMLEKLAIYKKAMPMSPIYYGGGYMRMKAGGFYTNFKGKGDIIGHSGFTGSFMFYYPHLDLHFVGDLAQIAPSKTIRLVLKLIMTSHKK